jgi:hypothetical protein
MVPKNISRFGANWQLFRYFVFFDQLSENQGCKAGRYPVLDAVSINMSFHFDYSRARALLIDSQNWAASAIMDINAPPA